MSTWLSLLTQSAEQKTYEITNLLPETEYTVSINGVYDSPVEIWLTTLNMDEDGIIETEVNQNNAVYVGDLENNKLTFTTQELHTALVIRTSGDLELTTIQLEKGNLATDWTFAPEEQEQRLSSLITQSADEIRLEVSEVKGDVSSNTAQLSVQAGQISSKVSANGIVSAINQTPETIKISANKINLTSVDSRINSNTAQLSVQADEISYKVSTNGVISAINQTSETIKINANKINLTGYVTVSSLSGQGTTTIDGSNIKTGTISANRINFNGATGSNVNLTGTITATEGKIGGWNINPSYIDTKSGNARLYLASHDDATQSYIAAYNSAGTLMFSVSKTGGLFARDANITGTITATQGNIGGLEIRDGWIETRDGTLGGFFIGTQSTGGGNYLAMRNTAGTELFRVTKAGKVYAKDADIEGKITATSGTFTGTVSGSSITGGSININNNFTVNSSGGVVAKSITTTGTHNGTVNATGGYFTGGGTGQFSGGYHNSGSFSYGAFGGTANFPSGTLGATTFTSVTSGVSFNGSISGGHRYTGGYNTSDIGTTDRPFRTIRYATALTKVSDIRLKDNFENIDNKFNDFVYSLPIGSYTLKGNDNPQLGINANLVDNLFPDEVTKYLINQDERGYYSANYEALVPMLVKVVQEQHHRLIDLEWRMSEMERRTT